MAAIVVSETLSRWTGNERTRASYLGALESNSESARKDLETMVLGLPHFEVKGTTDTSTDGVALDLTVQGVTFPDGTAREILVKAFVADDDGQGIVYGKAIIDGGATPIVTQDVVDADPITGGLGTAPTLDIDEVSNAVQIQALGVTDVDIRWVIHVWVGDAIRLPYIATT